MDLMASTFGKSQGNWLSSLIGGRKQQEASAEQDAANSASLEGADSGQLQSAPGESDLREATAAQADSGTVAAGAHEAFFTGEEQAGEGPAGSVEGEPAVPSGHPWQLSQHQGQASSESEAADTPSVPAAAFEPNVEQAPEEPGLGKDPALIEPAGVRVTPEPLLVEEPTRGRLSYGENEPDIAPAYAFLRGTVQRRAPEPPVIGTDPAELPGGEPVAASSRQQTSPPEFSAEDLSERLPAIVPNREALAEIPFLNPPPDFDKAAEGEERAEESEATARSVADPQTVDILVEKILEKLEPRLHDLLSKNLLKPLIENLVQNELQKKDR